jgi:hypothetical protein
MSEEADLVEVEWTGRKLFLKKDKLDEWHAMATDEQRVDYVNDHPEFRHTGGPIGVHRMKNEKQSLQEPDDLVLVHWSGSKVLLLERAQLDEWFSSSYEDHVDFVKQHPETVLH